MYLSRQLALALKSSCTKLVGNVTVLPRNYSSNRFAAQFKATGGPQANGTTLPSRKASANKPSSNRFASKYDNNNNNSRKGNEGLKSDRRHQDKRPHHAKKQHQPKKITFEFNTGADSAHNALRSIIDKVHQMNGGKYMVRYVNPETKKLETVHLASITNALDLRKQGIYIVPVKEDDGSLPIVRVNTLPEMLKAFSDEIADLRHQELLEKGSRAAKRSQQLKDRAEKKKSSTKIVTISWEISFSDFHNQKIREIQKKIDKGESFVIFIGDKKNLVLARKNVDRSDGLVKKMQGAAEEVSLGQRDDIEGDLEGEEDPQQHTTDDSYVARDLDVITRAKREKLIAEVKEYLSESVGKLEVSGTLDRRITYMCSKIKKAAPVQNENAAEGEVSVKEQRRLKRLQKQQEQQQLQLAKSKSKEEDLDLLYLNLKFED